MANLFPTNSIESITLKEGQTFELKKDYAINFETMEFIKNPDGTIKVLNAFDSYVQWCQLSMMTIRNEYKAYSHRFGRDRLNTNLNQEAIEMEIKRITTEALMVHPNTKSVSDFEYKWENGEVYYTYTVTPKEGRNVILSNTLKV